MTSSVVASGLTKSFGRRTAVDGVTLELPPGKVHVLLGPNGSGKTTLIRLFAGLLSASGGKVEALGHDPAMRRSEFLRQVGFLFDISAHWDPLSGEENAWYFARSYGLSAGEASRRLNELFASFELEAHKDEAVGTYSFGMRRKLAIIEALSHRPRLLLLDEPSVGLDLTTLATLHRELRKAANDGTTVIVSTNDMNEAKELADNVILLDSGRLLVSGPPSELIASLNLLTVLEVKSRSDFDLSPLRSIAGVRSASLDDKENIRIARIMVDSGSEEVALQEVVRELARQNAKVSNVAVRRPELGDVFLRHVGGGRRDA